MRLLPLLLVAAVAGCNTAPTADMAAFTAAEQSRLASLTAGKVAGTPISCLPSHRSNDMIVVGDNTLVFRESASRIYVNTVNGGCPYLGGRYALVTRNPTGSLCRGDIAQLADLTTGTTAGSCVLGDFVPYTTPRG